MISRWPASISARKARVTSQPSCATKLSAGVRSARCRTRPRGGSRDRGGCGGAPAPAPPAARPGSGRSVPGAAGRSSWRATAA